MSLTLFRQRRTRRIWLARGRDVAADVFGWAIIIVLGCAILRTLVEAALLS